MIWVYLNLKWVYPILSQRHKDRMRFVRKNYGILGDYAAEFFDKTYNL